MGGTGQLEIKGWLAIKPEEALQNDGYRFAAVSRKDTDTGLEVVIADALGTDHFVCKEQRAPQQLD